MKEDVKLSSNKHCSNLIGQRFERLVVLERADDEIDKKSGKHKTRWLCQCDCGNKKIVRGASLTSWRVKSCGCLHKEVSQKLGASKKGICIKHNKYDLESFDYGVGYTSNGDSFYFDKEDYDLIKDTDWHFGGKLENRRYLRGLYNGKDICMHRLIMGVLDNPNVVVDHIRANSQNDNRKENLRITTQARNCCNRNISKNNTSGCTGVSFNKRTNRYTAYIRVNGKQVFLGNYIKLDDAINARKQAEEKYYGEYSFNNSNKEIINDEVSN